MTIRFLLLVNKQGQTRLATYNEIVPLEERRQIDALQEDMASMETSVVGEREHTRFKERSDKEHHDGSHPKDGAAADLTAEPSFGDAVNRRGLPLPGHQHRRVLCPCRGHRHAWRCLLSVIVCHRCRRDTHSSSKVCTSVIARLRQRSASAVLNCTHRRVSIGRRLG